MVTGAALTGGPSPLRPRPMVRRSRAQGPRQRNPRTPTQCATGPDIIVVGSGITGLAISLELLRTAPGLTVTCLDGLAQLPGGATGAGQGYLWLAHRTPGSPGWTLAQRSKEMWRGWPAPGVDVGWRGAGSTLLAADAAGGVQLERTAAALAGAGVAASVLGARELAAVEPALAHDRLAAWPTGGAAALLVAGDEQVDGRAAAAALRAACLRHGRRFALVPGRVPRLGIPGVKGSVPSVVLEDEELRPCKGVVLAAGAWSGALLEASWPDAWAAWAGELAPRRGLLLDLPWPRGLPTLHTGTMEMEYARHYLPRPAATLGTPFPQAGGAGAAADRNLASPAVSISFTATRGAAGRLLLGSSREFAGFDLEAGVPAVADAVLDRARAFLPGLPGSWAAARGAELRVGLRPYAERGLPHIGPVPGCPGLWLAAGHEGSGLLLAPAGAELACDHILGRRPRLGAEVAQACMPAC
uniref:FAD-dependent oxidoreductase domain-containing protein 1 n=1 Tax=Auxenochlorella protothecoides TaxID=3075 RepID=A0A1D2A4F4_AUXPR